MARADRRRPAAAHRRQPKDRKDILTADVTDDADLGNEIGGQVSGWPRRSQPGSVVPFLDPRYCYPEKCCFSDNVFGVIERKPHRMKKFNL